MHNKTDMNHLYKQHRRMTAAFMAHIGVVLVLLKCHEKQ